jgi:hypothetical protein
LVVRGGGGGASRSELLAGVAPAACLADAHNVSGCCCTQCRRPTGVPRLPIARSCASRRCRSTGSSGEAIEGARAGSACWGVCHHAADWPWHSTRPTTPPRLPHCPSPDIQAG